MPAAIAIPAIIGAAGVGASIYGASKASGAAKDASQAQTDATKYAADLQKQSSDAALQFQKDMWAKQEENQAPWINTGTWALETLKNLTSNGGELALPYGKTFEAPTGLTMENDPGYQERLRLGQEALERSLAAKGKVTGGGAMKAAERYGQDYGSSEFGNVWNRALSKFNTDYNVWSNDQSNKFNRLASLASMGQTATGQLNSTGSGVAGNVSGINLNTGNALADLATQTGNARASGYVGGANAWNGAMSNTSSTLNSIPQYMMLMNLLKQPGAAG